MSSLLEEQAAAATAERAQLRAKDWQPSHQTKATFAKFEAANKARQLAATAIWAGRLHREGSMSDLQYAQRLAGLEQEAAEAGLTQRYHAAREAQLANETGSKAAASEAVRLLEQMRREADERFRQALAELAAAARASTEAKAAVEAAEQRREKLERLIEELDAAVNALVRG